MRNIKLDHLFEYLKENRDKGIVGLQFELHYGNKISNSHSCPKNGVRNWESNPDLPTGYPGLFGRIWFRTDGTEIGNFSQPVCNIAHTGSGGYGAYDGKWDDLYNIYTTVANRHDLHYFSYDCKIFGDDFPDILSLAATHKMLREEIPNNNFTYYWLDDEFIKKDITLKAKYKRKQERRYLNDMPTQR